LTKKLFTVVPEMWSLRLAEIRADGCTYRLALYLLQRARWEQHVTLSNQAMHKIGVGREGKRNALCQLREAGLVAVEERPRKSPIVKVRWTD
jgi:hypothetical protein